VLLKSLLESNSISQAEVARGIGRSEAFVSRLLSGETGASQETIAALLSYMSHRLGRQVAYEDLFSVGVGGAA